METSRRTDVRLEVLGGRLERATPVARYRIEADIAPDEASLRLAVGLARPMVENEGSFLLARRTWEGRVTSKGVRVVGPRGYRQPTMVAEGQVGAGPLGTAIELRVAPTTLSWFSLSLIAVWVVGGTALMWGSVLTLFPILMACGIYLVEAITMRSEAKHIAGIVVTVLKD